MSGFEIGVIVWLIGCLITYFVCGRTNPKPLHPALKADDEKIHYRKGAVK